MDESATRPQHRLQQLSLTAWEILAGREDGNGGGEGTGAVTARRAYLRTRQQLLAEGENVLGILPEQRSRLLLREDAPAAALLIHGSTGNPADLQGLADSLHSAGLDVWNLRLPGHGLPGDSRPAVTWRACYLAARQAWRDLGRGHRRIHLVGFSFGAALAVLLAAKVRPASLVLLAPALEPRLPWFTRLLLRLRVHRLPWVRRRFGWDLEVLAAMTKARGQLGRLRLPVYAAHCQDDPRVDPSSLRLLQRRIRHPAARFRLYPRGGHEILRAHGPAGLYREIQEFLRLSRR